MYKYTSEELYTKAENEAAIVDESEWESWKLHPCGRALKARLQGDQSSFFEAWVNSTRDEAECKWLLRYSESLLQYIYEEGALHRQSEEKEIEET